MSDMAFAMTVCEPRRVSSDSFWVDAPREHFTDLCRERAFQHLPRRGDRIRTIAQEIAAASRGE